MLLGEMLYLLPCSTVPTDLPFSALVVLFTLIVRSYSVLHYVVYN